MSREKREIVRRFVDYRGRRFNWSGMMAKLYRLYSLTLGSGDRLNTSSHSLSRSRSTLQPASGSPIIALFENTPPLTIPLRLSDSLAKTSAVA